MTLTASYANRVKILMDKYSKQKSKTNATKNTAKQTSTTCDIDNCLFHRISVNEAISPISNQEDATIARTDR